MKPKVLLVDDDDEFAELVRFNLERQGCEMRIARNGAEGLRLTREQLPDVILLDLMLPDIGGLPLCQILQSRPRTREIPIFIVTALDRSWFERGDRPAKFDQFFQKPVDLKALYQSIFVAWGGPRTEVSKRAH